MKLTDLKALVVDKITFKGTYKANGLPITFLLLSEEITIEDYSSDRVMLSSTLASYVTGNGSLNAEEKQALANAQVVLEHNDNGNPVLFAKCSAMGESDNSPKAKAFMTWLKSF